jgi:hypothetical protein
MEGADIGGIELLTDDIPTTSIQNTKTAQGGMSKDTTDMAIHRSVGGEAQGDLNRQVGLTTKRKE